jgi:hypothetical protein
MPAMFRADPLGAFFLIERARRNGFSHIVCIDKDLVVDLLGTFIP